MREMNDTKKLLPCPFCGGKAYFRVTTSGYQNDKRLIGFQIECRECKVSFPKRFELEIRMNESGDIETPKDDRNKAIEEWNKRV